jgi:Protein of unknown function (DUF2829)
MQNAKRYVGTKTLNAQPMTRGAYNTLRGWDLPTDEDGEDEGYFVEYTDGGKPNTAKYDGYVSWSPKEQFEAAYREAAGLTFGQTLEALKVGKKAVRSGWNGRGMFIYLVPAASYPVQTGAAQSIFGEGAMVPYNAYLAIKNVNKTVSTWVPSINDVLAEDWSIE